MWGGVSTAWAQHFLVSDAPSNGQWAEKTYWYYIQNQDGKGWISTASSYVDGSNLKLSSSTQPTDDAGKWCVVGDEATGYRFYNKESGTAKVLGIAYSSGNGGGGSRASMIDYSSESVSSTDENGVGFLFSQSNTTYSNGAYDAFYLKGVSGNTQRYWNQRDGYLSYWATTSGNGLAVAGSSFKFVAVEELDEVLYSSKVHVGELYYPTQDIYDAYKDKAASSMADEEKTTVISALRTNIKVFEGGEHVMFGNLLHADRYVYARETNRNNLTGGYLGSGTAKDNYRYMFTIVKGSNDGKFKIYSNAYKKYVGDVPSANDTQFQLVDESNAKEFTIALGNTLGYCTISDPNSTVHSQYNALHMVNWDGVVRWEVSAPASNFKVIPVTDEITEAWDNNLQAKRAKVTEKKYVGYSHSNDAYVAALANYNTSSDEDKPYYSRLLIDAIPSAEVPESNKYYTIQCARSPHATYYHNGKYFTEGYGDTESTGGENALIDVDLAANVVPSLWQFAATGTDGHYYIKSANSKNVLNKSNGSDANGMIRLTATEANKGQYELSSTSGVLSVNGAVALVCKNSNDGTLSCRKEDKHVVAWNGGNDGSANNFYVCEVTEIPVTVTSVGYATLNLPFAVNIPSDVRAFMGVKNTDNEIVLQELTGVIPAETPVILHADAATYQFPIAYGSTETTTVTSALSGTLVPYTIADGVSAYILKNGTHGIGLYKVTSDTDRTIGANKAYFQMETTSNESASFAFSFDDVTGINQAIAGSDVDNVYYDLNGRRVLYPVHGIYVKGNGQKVYIK